MSDGHKYLQVREQLEDILDEMAPGQKLPTERALASDFGVSRMTIRQAIDGLQASGLVHRVQGSGTYVSEGRISKTGELTGFSEDMRLRGFVPSSEVVNISTRLAGEDLGRALQIGAGEDVIRIERVRLADRRPMCLETVHLPVAVFADMDPADLQGSLYDALAERGVHLVEADQTITAAVLDGPQAALLGVPVLSPAIVMTRVSYDERRAPLEHSVSVYRADRYDIRMTVRRVPSPHGRPSAESK